jgi:hypothetical protein
MAIGEMLLSIPQKIQAIFTQIYNLQTVFTIYLIAVIIVAIIVTSKTKGLDEYTKFQRKSLMPMLSFIYFNLENLYYVPFGLFVKTLLIGLYIYVSLQFAFNTRFSPKIGFLIAIPLLA